MGTNLSQNVSQKQVLQQRLILTQELQLFLKLIQMNTIELKEYLDEQLIENPTLEESEDPADKKDDKVDEEIDFDNFTDGRLLRDRSEDIPHYNMRETYDDADETAWENRVSEAETLIDHLRWQVKISDLTNEEKRIADIIVCNTNEDGYLEADIEDVARIYVSDIQQANEGNGYDEEAAINAGITAGSKLREMVADVLEYIHSSFDPTGVCARDLKECITIQATDMGYQKGDLLINIVENYLDDLDEKDASDIAEEMGRMQEEVREALQTISG